METKTSSPAFNLSLIAAATINSASSRLRCYGLARELVNLGYQATVSDEVSKFANVLLVQKKVSALILEQVKNFKKRGGVILYDIDDHGDLALGSLKASEDIFSDFLACVDVVLVDTETRKETLLKDIRYSGIKNFWVIPDPIDYIEGLGSVFQYEKSTSRDKLKGCWFGNAPNIIPAIPYLLACNNLDNSETLQVITNSEFVLSLQNNFPLFKVSAWTLNDFPSLLSSMDYCVLIHDSSLEGVQKSNNKMLASLARGVVPFVSRTPAYEATALDLGLPELILDSVVDLQNRLNTDVFRGIQRKIMNSECQDKLKRFSPANSANLFIKQLQKYMSVHASNGINDVKIKLNLGSGGSPLSGYINVDVASERIGISPDIVCDIRDLKVFPDDYADEIISVHVVEHFWRWEVVDIIMEWVRILKPGGKLILETPNLISACEEIIKDPNTASGPGPEGQRSMWCLYGDPVHQDPLICHRWLYTPVSLGQVLHQSGLVDLKREPAEFKLRDPRDMRITGIKPY